jgi:hypothetical protein
MLLNGSLLIPRIGCALTGTPSTQIASDV